MVTRAGPEPGPDTENHMRFVLFQPDIAPNVGTMLRLAACLGVAVDVIEPCGFPWDEKALRRAAMDYIAHADITRHASWDRYQEASATGGAPGRLVLLTTTAETPYNDFTFRADDRLMVGRESDGVPEAVHTAAAARLRVPLQPGLRTVNVALALAMVAGEALRQTNQFPGDPR